MRYAGDEQPDIQRRSPAIWYDANGWEWGRIGPNGELLDHEGNPREEVSKVTTWQRWGPLYLLLALALGVSCAWWGYWLQ